MKTLKLVARLGVILCIVATPADYDPATGTVSAQSQQAEQKVDANVGEQAPDFQLRQVDGRPVSLSDLRGHPLVLIFWTGWCSICRTEAPDFNRLAQRYQVKGVRLLGINIQDSEKQEVFAQLRQNSLVVPSSESQTLSAAAADHRIILVIGVNERVDQGPGNGTLYNSLLTLGSDGTLLNHHRKLVPTYTERMVWGQGEGGGLKAVDTSMGRVGGLICWEHGCLSHDRSFTIPASTYISPSGPPSTRCTRLRAAITRLKADAL